MRKVTTENKVRKSLSLAISVLMIASLASVMLLAVPLVGATATSILPPDATPETGDVVTYTVHSDTTSGTVTVRLVVDKNKDDLYQSATDVIAENTGSGAPGGVDITLYVDTRGYANGTYKVYAAEGAEPSGGEDLTSWSDVTTTFTTTDGTPPVFKSAITGDSVDGNSSVKDKIYLEFTEDGSGLDSATVTTDDFTVTSPNIDVYSVDTGDNYIILTLASEIDTTATKPSVNYAVDAFADIAGNKVAKLEITVTSDGISPTMDSAETKTTTTIEVTFSETLTDGTAHKENFSVSGNTVTNATEEGAVVTLTLGTAIATDAIPDVTYTKGILADDSTNKNLAETTTLTPADKAGPVLEYVAWTDVDGSEEVNGGDTLEFAFSEPMDKTTITAITIDDDLDVTEGHIYGSVNPLLTWTADNKVLKVTLAYGATIESTDTISPASSVKDANANEDATPSAVGIHNVSDPVILNELRYPTIQSAIDAASSGDTIEVGTAYDSTKEDFPITVDVSNLTIRAASGATPVIDAADATISEVHGIIDVMSDNVTIDGLTLKNLLVEPTAGIYVHNDGVNVYNCTIENTRWGIHGATCADDLTVENSTIKDSTDTGLLLNVGGTVRNNVFENNHNAALVYGGDSTFENNTFRDNGWASIVFMAVGDTPYGTLTVENNNFVGTADYAIVNNGGKGVTAENNYWNDDSGPSGAAAEGAGEAIYEQNGAIDYDPWLTEEDGQHYDFTYVLDEGLNLVSLPLIPDVDSIGTVLAETEDVNSVWSWNNEIKDWDSYTPGNGGDLTEMVDGEGYWIRIDETAENKTVLAFNGHEYVSGVEEPSAYDVYVGWNLIGYKRTTSVIRSAYLGVVVNGITERCFQSPRGTYDIIETDNDMTPGYGYWLAVTADGTIYP